jgi:hypothetical protein
MSEAAQERTAFSAGDAPKTVATTVVAFYDPATGAIRFSHTAHVFAGADRHGTDPVAEACRAAQRLGCPTAGLAVAVSSVLEHGHLPHRIDPQTGEFRSEPG